MADRLQSLRERAAARTRPGGDLPDPPSSRVQDEGSSDQTSLDGERVSPRSRSDRGGIDPRLLIWLSPAFPVGAFAYSHGLELAADRGWVRDRAALEAWLRDLVELGSLRNDLILLACAWRAVEAADQSTLAAANELALALQPSAERRLETVTQGNAFLATVRAVWPSKTPAAPLDALAGDVAYPIAVAAWTAALVIPLEGTLQAYGLAFVSSLVSAAIRLSVVGQTDGQRVIAALLPAIEDAATVALSTTLDDIGAATLRSDLASLAHETQYSRLFRS